MNNPFRSIPWLNLLSALWMLGAAFLGIGCASQKSTIEKSEAPPKKTEVVVRETVRTGEDWVEETLKRLSLEEKAAQIVAPKVFGLYTSTQSAEWQRVVHLVRERKVGGIAVFAGEVYETAMMINRLQELADVPLLVSADFERGLAMRTRRTTPFPEAMALAATRDTHLAYEMGRIVAEESRAIGIHQNFAPVADININPNNPVINIRSYGEDPHWVAEIAAAYAAGLQSSGMIATAKHFPGHGDTEVDSHLGLPILDVTRARLDSFELVPFRKLIAQGILSVMVGHLAVPAVEPQRMLPATLSANVVTHLLRQELNFQGLIVSDALEMQGLLEGFGLGEAAVRAVEAGVEMLLVPPIERDDDVIDALHYAVKTGRLTEQRINDSVKKILSLKQSLGLPRHRTVDLAQIPEIVGTPEHWDVALAIARSAITVLKNDDILPLQRLGLRRKILNVILSDNDDYRTEIHRSSGQLLNERAGNYFTAELRKRSPNVESFRLDPRTNALELDSLLTRVETSEVILCPVFVKARSGSPARTKASSAKFGLPQQVIDFANLVAAKGKPTVFIAMGSPYILGSLNNGSAYLCAYSDGELATEAMIEVLFGEIPSRGRLPVTIPGMFKIGSGLDLPQYVLREDSPARIGFDSKKLATLTTIMTNAIRDSAFPGAQLHVAKDGAIVYNKSFGRLEYSDTSAQVNSATMYDLASLTKVFATTSAVMKLYEERKLNLDDTVARFIPQFANRGKEKITIRNLLLHDAGLPAFKKLYLTCKSAQEALDSIYNCTLIYPPGDSTVYSDFGPIVLGRVIEKVTRMRFDAYVTRTFFTPLGMERTMFNPPKNLWDNIAPTELDAVWRKKLVRGTVHDETAALLDGVAGHAGLFSTASDLAIFMHMLMNGGSYRGKQFLKPETIQLFTARPSLKSTRTLGWDMKTLNGSSSAGSLFSERSFGHLGFTGTSIWADPERKIFVILLTNRVYPTRENIKIRKVRPAVHDAVVKALINDTYRSKDFQNNRTKDFDEE